MIIGTALTDSDIYWEMGVKGENESSRCLEEQAFQPEETARSKASRWTCLYLGVFGAQPPGERARVSDAGGGRRQSRRKGALVWASAPKLPSVDVFGHDGVLECACIRQTPSELK